MDIMKNRYWPFPVPPAHQLSERGRSQIGFLEAGHQAGFRPYTFGGENFGATAERRTGEIIYRGRGGKHWEILLSASEGMSLSAHVTDFSRAADALLQWLHGASSTELRAFLQSHLLKTPGCPQDFQLREPQPHAARKSARMFIWQAIVKVLEQEEQALSPDAIYQRIASTNLYDFKAEQMDHVDVVRNEIRKRCANIDMPSARKLDKIFMHVGDDHYELLRAHLARSPAHSA